MYQFMIHFIAIILFNLSLLCACNNQQTQRLSKHNFYQEKNDIAAFALTQNETKILKPTIFLDEDLFSVLEFKSTITLTDTKENKITLSLIGKNVSNSTINVSIKEVAGLTPQSKIIKPASFRLPITNEKGFLLTFDVIIEFNSSKESFLSVYTKQVPPIENDSELDPKTPPQVFTSFYSSSDDEIALYEFKKPEKGVPLTYFLHHQNTAQSLNILRISTRLTLKKILQ